MVRIVERRLNQDGAGLLADLRFDRRDLGLEYAAGIGIGLQFSLLPDLDPGGDLFRQGEIGPKLR